MRNKPKQYPNGIRWEDSIDAEIESKMPVNPIWDSERQIQPSLLEPFGESICWIIIGILFILIPGLFLI